MTVTIDGILVTGTPSEISQLIKLHGVKVTTFPNSFGPFAPITPTYITARPPCGGTIY